MATVLSPGRSERGAALAMVVIWLPVLLLFFMFVVDVGNWFMHKRHLQMQADAGALAGGGVFRIPCADTPILDATRKYAGDPNASAPYNLQVSPTNQANVHALINATTYWNKGGVDYNDGGQPCATKFIDVKMTEANLPWWMRLSVVPAINAHARVSILEKEGGTGALPIGVPDSNPAAAAAIFVNEVNGTVIGTQSLTTTQPITANGGESLTLWTGDPVSISIASAHTGVVIALAGQAGWTPSGTLSQICDQVLVQCYDGAEAGPWTGLSHIQGYQTTGTGSPTAPILRDVTFYNVGCTDDSAPYFLVNSGCSVGVKAKIDFGADPQPAGAQVKVGGGDCPPGGQSPKGCIMAYQTTGPNAGYWVTNGTAQGCASGCYPVISAASSTTRLDLNWATTASGNNTTPFSAVQRAYTASTTTSGAIHYVVVSDNSLSIGSHTVGVGVGIKGSLQANATSVNDPVVHLKIVGGTSQNQSLDCDPDVANLRDELGYGCAPQYIKNTGEACPLANDPLWDDPTTQPWTCVRVGTGNAAGQVNQGMLIRTQEGSNTCLHPNNWSLFDTDEGIPAGDPRIVQVFLTPFGAFGGSGSNHAVPVTGFATFYITGWSQGNGGQQGDPCPNADAVNGGGEITGHFIKYIESINTGPTGGLCDFNSFGTCVAVLTE